MGVTGLWNLIEPCGKPVPLETLENKILAIDISIWLHQVVKGFQDNRGCALANAHLLGLFHRLCKLLYYRIKPVFVFDGKMPQVKKDTIAKRNQSRNKILNEADRIQNLLLQSLAKEKVVQQALGTNAIDLLLSPTKSKQLAERTSHKDDIFRLPELPTIDEGDDRDDNQQTLNDCIEHEDVSSENPRNFYNGNLQTIDVTSSYFKNLPPDIRHELLTDIKETRKQSSWGRLHELPPKGDDFSSFQMKRLLKRRQVQVSLEDAEKEMGGKSLTLIELQNMFADDGIVDPNSIALTKHIASNENTRYLLVKKLKKSVETAKETDDPQPSTSKTVLHMESKSCLKKDINPKSTTDKDYDIDLQLAIELSLHESNVYNKDDYEYQKAAMSNEQKKQLRDAAVKLAKPYMIEYGGMNNADFNDLLQEEENGNTINKMEQVVSKEQHEQIMASIPNPNGESSCHDELFPKPHEEIANETVCLISDNESDTDFIVVSDNEETSLKLNESVVRTERDNFEICLNLSELDRKDDDLFADMFENQTITERIGTDHCDKNLKTPRKTTSLADTSANKILGDLGGNKIDSSILEISDTDLQTNLPGVIEIFDNEEKNESDLLRTPSRSKSKINGYFQSEYIVKRTPDKEKEKDEITPKVKSPFFEKRNQSSDKRRKRVCSNKDEKSSPSRKKKVSKELFEKSKEVNHNIEEEINPLVEAASLLKKTMNRAELENLATEMAKQNMDLEKERNRQDRMGSSITEKMSLDCMQLLRLFGIPYIIAPMEAEAQCAYLDAMNLTDGTISDDSDIWLFGGKTVYKNFFVQSKHVMEFKADNIKKLFNVDRKKLIQLATLVGSDYTTGIRGIGAVTALEILATFSQTSQNNNDTTEHMSVLSTLQQFRDWWKNAKNTPGISSNRVALRKKLKNIDIHDEFPNKSVVEAYLTPTVDENRERFSWGTPDVNTIQDFARKHLGWTKKKTDDILIPVLKRLSDVKTQSSIKNYFTVKSDVSKNFKVSKRVQKAIQKMSADYKSDEDDSEVVNIIRKKATYKQGLNASLGKKIEADSSSKVLIKKKTSSTHTAHTSLKISKKTDVISNTKQYIPQRENEIAEMKMKKMKAAELLKKSEEKKRKVK